MTQGIGIRLTTRVHGTRQPFCAIYYEDLIFGSAQMRSTGAPRNYIQDLCQGTGVEFRFVNEGVVLKPHIAGVMVDDEFVGREQTVVINTSFEHHDMWVGPIHFNLEVYTVENTPSSPVKWVKP